MICSKCKKETPDDSKYCIYCGSKVFIDCTNCHQKLKGEESFCPNCGYKIKKDSALIKEEVETYYAKDSNEKEQRKDEQFVSPFYDNSLSLFNRISNIVLRAHLLIFLLIILIVLVRLPLLYERYYIVDNSDIFNIIDRQYTIESIIRSTSHNHSRSLLNGVPNIIITVVFSVYYLTIFILSIVELSRSIRSFKDRNIKKTNISVFKVITLLNIVFICVISLFLNNSTSINSEEHYENVYYLTLGGGANTLIVITYISIFFVLTYELLYSIVHRERIMNNIFSFIIISLIILIPLVFSNNLFIINKSGSLDSKEIANSAFGLSTYFSIYNHYHLNPLFTKSVVYYSLSIVVGIFKFISLCVIYLVILLDKNSDFRLKRDIVLFIFFNLLFTSLILENVFIFRSLYNLHLINGELYSISFNYNDNLIRTGIVLVLCFSLFIIKFIFNIIGKKKRNLFSY